MNMLEVTNLQKSYGSRKAVNGISFAIKKGEVFGLLGPNGAGKSTTISLICGILKAHGGQVLVDGHDVRTDQAKRLIGVVPQEPALYSTLSARANLHFWGTINGVQPSHLEQAVGEALTLVGLENRADERISKFSGGMKRRLNIAAGLIHSPSLLIMDEPTVGIDPQSRNHILSTVKQLQQKDLTVLYTSHYVEEVEYLCDRTAIMDAGQIIAEGTLEELLQRSSQLQELTIRLNAVPDGLPGTIKKLNGVNEVRCQNNSLQIKTNDAEQVLARITGTITACGAVASDIKLSKPNLESLFLQLTGKTLRD